MLWKDNYKIGVSKIDKQHYVLFYEIEKLIYKIQKKEDKNFKGECLDTIKFLKEYVEYHFRDEEAYQQGIGYKGYKAHKQLHEDFKNSVHEYELLFEKDGINGRIVRDFCGMLLTWLIHHVEDCDMRISTGKPLDIEKTTDIVEAIKQNTAYVLEEMFSAKNITIKNSLYRASLQGDLYSIAEVSGGIKAEIVFCCHTDTALSMVNYLTGMDITKPDDMVYSALSEVVQIISSRMVVSLSGSNGTCQVSNIKTIQGKYNINNNEAYSKTNTIVLSTQYGVIEVLVLLVDFNDNI